MSDAQDIRTWARDRGLPVGVRGKLSNDVIAAWEAEHVNGDGAVTPEGGELGDSPGIQVTPERRPEGDGGPGARQVRGFAARMKTRSKDRPKPSRPAGRRVSIENVVTYGWGGIAYAVAQNPRALPLARVLNMQAPIAGVVVEDMAKGTLIDRMLQPLARAGEKGEKGMGLLGPPVIVGVITARPELFPVLAPLLKLSLVSWLEISGPAAKKIADRAARFEEKFGDIDLDAMIESLFAPPGTGPAPGAAWSAAVSEQEEENIRKARDA